MIKRIPIGEFCKSNLETNSEAYSRMMDATFAEIKRTAKAFKNDLINTGSKEENILWCVSQTQDFENGKTFLFTVYCCDISDYADTYGKMSASELEDEMDSIDEVSDGFDEISTKIFELIDESNDYSYEKAIQSLENLEHLVEDVEDYILVVPFDGVESMQNKIIEAKNNCNRENYLQLYVDLYIECFLNEFDLNFQKNIIEGYFL